jgi:hypothetical protein
MATLARIGLTPLKGTALHHPTAVRLTEAGIAANRRFHLVDERGALFTSEGHGPLVRVVATFDPAAETLRLELPDGRVIGDRADGLGGPVVTDFYGRPVAGRLVDGPFAAALSAYIGRPVRLVRTDREGDGSDVHRLTLISSASVRELGTRSGRPDLDARRFRMDLELGGCAPFEEDAWAGRQVRVGAAVVMVLGPVPRCVVTTRDPTSGLKDFDTLKRIAEFRPLMTDPRGVPFGMYAEVVRPGLVRVGDDVGPLLG